MAIIDRIFAHGEQATDFLPIGVVSEFAGAGRVPRRRNPKTGQPYPWIVRSSAMVNHYYVYAMDRDFGPFFLKFCSYPFNAKLYLNGHEYAKQQLARKGIAFTPLDNGVLSCANPARLQQICDGLSAEKIDALLRKPPSPINCAVCACTARSSACPTAFVIASPRLAFAPPCSSRGSTTASCARPRRRNPGSPRRRCPA